MRESPGRHAGKRLGLRPKPRQRPRRRTRRKTRIVENATVIRSRRKSRRKTRIGANVIYGLRLAADPFCAEDVAQRAFVGERSGVRQLEDPRARFWCWRSVLYVYICAEGSFSQLIRTLATQPLRVAMQTTLAFMTKAITGIHEQSNHKRTGSSNDISWEPLHIQILKKMTSLCARLPGNYRPNRFVR